MCLIYIIGQLLVLAMLFRADSSTEFMDLPGVSMKFTDWLHALGLLLLGLLGAYGAFYKHHPSIRAFSLLSALNVLLLTFLLLYTMSPEDMRDQSAKTVQKLKGYMPDYDWDYHYNYDEHNKEVATKSWNFIQKTGCCGIKGSDDWAEYRPKGGKYEDGYPPSCCLRKGIGYDPSGGVCTKSDMLFVTGCSERLDQILAFAFILQCGTIIYQLALSVISYMVGNCTFESRQPRHAMTMSVPRSVYVNQQQAYQQPPYQQPPVNRSYSDAPKQSPMYPNLHGSGNVNYSAPPPSYGT